METKYVIIKVHGHEAPVVFPELVNHSSFKGFNPVSAGFVNLPNLVHTYWESISLNLKPRPQDAEIIARALNLTS